MRSEGVVMLGQNAARRFVVQVVTTGEQLQVWFCPRYQPRVLVGGVSISLARDAVRYGQDLLDGLIDKALRMADRRSSERKSDRVSAS